MEPTLNDPKLRTWKDAYGKYDFTKKNPWRSPGHSPIGSPCGLAGGGPTRHPGNGANAPKGTTQGADGRDLPEGPQTQWQQGSVQEVAWAIVANHGGGYAYRLCPKSSNLTEACFQANHLDFVSDQSWIQYGDDKTNRTAIPATRVADGTNPAGSQWTKNPIPACAGLAGGAPGGAKHVPFWNDCRQAQFDPPLKGLVATHPKFAPMPGLYGFGVGVWTSQTDHEEFKFWAARFNFNIIDKVQIPVDLPAGDYVLGLRWDCEQTPQIWSNCADVTITSGRDIVETKTDEKA